MLLTVKGRLEGWLVFAIEAGGGFGVVELGYVLCLAARPGVLPSLVVLSASMIRSGQGDFVVPFYLRVF